MDHRHGCTSLLCCLNNSGNKCWETVDFSPLAPLDYLFFFFSFLFFPRRCSSSSAIFGSPRQASRPHPNLWRANYFSLQEKASTLYLGDRNSAAMWRRAVYSGASCCSAHLRNNISVWKGHSRGWPAFTAPLCLIYVTLFFGPWLFLLGQSQMQLVKIAEKAVILQHDHKWRGKSWISSLFW